MSTMVVARTPLHHWHTAHGARFAESDGWQIVEGYPSREREVQAARDGTVLADVSAHAKISLLGDGVGEMVSAWLGPDRAPKLLGVAAVDGGLACRLRADHLLLLAHSTSWALEGDSPSFLKGAVPLDVTSAYAGFFLSGRAALELLSRLTALDVSSRLQGDSPSLLKGPVPLDVSSCAETNLAGVHALLVRIPRPQPAAVYIYVSWDFAEYVWERLLDAGQDLGLTPIGMAAYRELIY